MGAANGPLLSLVLSRAVPGLALWDKVAAQARPARSGRAGPGTMATMLGHAWVVLFSSRALGRPFDLAHLANYT
jgi:hypothetical protein